MGKEDQGPSAPTAFGAPSPSSSATAGATPISHLSQEQEKVKAIREAIRAEDKRLRTAYPFPLGHKWQSACGLAIYLGACGLEWLACLLAGRGVQSVHPTTVCQ